MLPSQNGPNFQEGGFKTGVMLSNCKFKMTSSYTAGNHICIQTANTCIIKAEVAIGLKKIMLSQNILSDLTGFN